MVVELAKLWENMGVGFINLQHAGLENPTFFLLYRLELDICVFN